MGQVATLDRAEILRSFKEAPSLTDTLWVLAHLTCLPHVWALRMQACRECPATRCPHAMLWLGMHGTSTDFLQDSNIWIFKSIWNMCKADQRKAYEKLLYSQRYLDIGSMPFLDGSLNCNRTGCSSSLKFSEELPVQLFQILKELEIFLKKMAKNWWFFGRFYDFFTFFRIMLNI